MIRVELVDRSDTEQFHGSDDVISEYLGCTPHPGLTACHQTVQIRPTDEGGTCSERDRSNDVRSIENATVDEHLGVISDGVNRRLHQTERHRRAIELSSTVVRQNDGVGSDINGLAGVFDCLDPFHDNRTGPMVPKPRQVVERQTGVEEPIGGVDDRSFSRLKRGKSQGFRRQEVEPPSWVHGSVERGSEGEVRWNRHSVAHVSSSGATDGEINREYQGTESR
jgi:hypothetical protein